MKTDVIKKENKKNWTRFQFVFLYNLALYLIMNIGLLRLLAMDLKKEQETCEIEIEPSVDPDDSNTTFWEFIKMATFNPFSSRFTVSFLMCCTILAILRQIFKILGSTIELVKKDPKA